MLVSRLRCRIVVQGNRECAEEATPVNDVADGPDVEADFDRRLGLGPAHYQDRPMYMAGFLEVARVAVAHLEDLSCEKGFRP